MNLRLQDLPAQIWDALETGALVPEDALHVAVLISTAATGGMARTMVLQHASRAERSLSCYSDVRAPKVAQIRSTPRLSWLFYDARTRTQIRADGAATIHHGDDLARRCWALLPVQLQANYCSAHAPGTPISTPDNARSMSQGVSLTDLDLQMGFSNFAVIRCLVDGFDWLQLGPRGHARASFTWTGNGFEGEWLAA